MTNTEFQVEERRKPRHSIFDDVTQAQRSRRIQFPVFVLVMHSIFIILFGVFIRYAPHQAVQPWNPDNLSDGNEAEKRQAETDFETSGKFDPDHMNNGQFIDLYYPMFEDVQVMVFLGFGFVIAFMRFFCLTAVTMNYMLACFAIEWALLMNGWFTWDRHPDTIDKVRDTCGWGMGNHHDHCTPIDIKTITNALFAVTTVLISCGALLGKVTPMQMAINVCFEITLYSVNRWIILDIIEANDAGHGMSVHAFGAYWGMAAATILYNKKLASAKGAREAYANELFVFIGTLFLFVFWPSWNAAQEVGLERHRAVVNTFLSIISSCITTYAISAVLDKQGRFTVQHLQNATLAGGVGIGSIASGVVHPFGALLIGMVAGLISVLGYQFLTPALNRIGVHDSAGVHNLHGLPGIYASVISAIVAGSVTAKGMGTIRAENTLFPGMASFVDRMDESDQALFVDGRAYHGTFPESERNQTRQGGMQFVAVLITMGISIAGGIVSGFFMRIPGIDQPDPDHLAEDNEYYVPHWGELGAEDAPMTSKNSMFEMRGHDEEEEGPGVAVAIGGHHGDIELKETHRQQHEGQQNE